MSAYTQLNRSIEHLVEHSVYHVARAVRVSNVGACCLIQQIGALRVRLLIGFAAQLNAERKRRVKSDYRSRCSVMLDSYLKQAVLHACGGDYIPIELKRGQINQSHLAKQRQYSL